MDDLLNMLLKHVSYRFACVVGLASYMERLSEQRRREFLINAYVLAARGVVQRANEWTLFRDRQPVEHVFEDDDEGKGLLMRRLEIEGLPRPRFRWAVDRPRGLQRFRAQTSTHTKCCVLHRNGLRGEM